jgi:hypothetical protein
MGGFQMPEPPITPGPFAAGLSRNDRTIPGVGVECHWQANLLMDLIKESRGHQFQVFHLDSLLCHQALIHPFWLLGSSKNINKCLSSNIPSFRSVHHLQICHHCSLQHTCFHIHKDPDLQLPSSHQWVGHQCHHQ